jgi:hypothetical protein
VLESVCVLPQLLLLRQTTIPTVITSFYIVFLGSYRGLYLLNWLLKELDTNMKPPNPVSIIFGIIQTALYLDFAWVYWSRQRVKLRNGGIVDADDLSRGWLLRRIFGNKQFAAHDIDGNETDDDEESALHGSHGNNRHYNHHTQTSGRGGVRPKWGSRGISISADEGVLEREAARTSLDDDLHRGGGGGGVADDGVLDPDAKMRDPDELARALQDDEDDDEAGAGAGAGAASSSSSASAAAGQQQNKLKEKEKQTHMHTDARGHPSGVRNGDEWDDD